MRTTLLVSALATAALAPAALAQLQVTSNSQSTTITFGANLGWEDASPTDNPVTSNDVWRRTDTGGINPAGNARFLLETTPFSTASGDYGPSSRAFSLGASAIDLDGAGPLASGQASFFGDDFNGDADTTDNFNVLSGSTIFGSTNTFGIALTAPDVAIAFGTNGSPGSAGYTRPFRDYTFTLRIQNTSGGPISQWSSRVDSWWGDDDTANATMSLAWSTNLTTWTVIDSFTTTDAGDTNQLLTERDMSGSFTATVADTAFLYLRIANLRTGAVAATDGGLFTAGSGSGAALAIDNWNVTAIPEPSTIGLLAGVLALGGVVVARRRRS